MEQPERVATEDDATPEQPDRPAAPVRTRKRGSLQTWRTGWLAHLQSESLAGAAHYLSLIVALPIFLRLTRHHWFIGDEWDFIARRGVLGRSELGLFEPHNEHWSTIPILVYRALFTIFGLRTYVPYFLVAILLHLAVVHCVWRLLRQAGVGGWLAGSLALTLLLGGAGAESFLWSFQVGFTGALFLGLVLLLLVNRAELRPRRRLLAGSVAVLGLLFAGIAVPLVATAAFLAWLRHGWRIALQVTGPAGCVYLLWLKLVGSEGLHTHVVTKRGLLLVPSYSWKGLVTTVEGYTFFAGAGAVILLALGFALLRMGGRAIAGEQMAITGGLGAVALFITVAPGRVALGISQADSARYHYLAWSLLLLSIGVCLHRLVSGETVRQVALIAVILACVAHGTDSLITAARAMEAHGQDHRRLITAAAELVDSGAPVFPVPPHPVTAPDLNPSSLEALIRSGALPRFSGVTAKDHLLAVSQLQLRLPPAASLPVPQTGSTRVNRTVNTTTSVASPGCLLLRPERGRPEISLHALEPSGISVLSLDGGELRLLLRDTTGLTVDPGRTVSLTAGTQQSIDLATVLSETILLLPPTGPTTVCGIRP